MTSDIQGRLLAVALNSLRSRGKLLSGLRMFLRNAHLGVIIIGQRCTMPIPGAPLFLFGMGGM